METDFALDSEFLASPAGAPGGPPEAYFVVVVAVVFYFFRIKKVSKVYLFLKFFNFWPLYLLPELRNPRMLPDSPRLS